MKFLDIFKIEKLIRSKMKKLLGVDSLTPTSKKKVKKQMKQIEMSRLKELNSKRATRFINVAGVTYDNRQYLLHTISRKFGSEGLDKITFVKEPENPYDPNAIKVMFDGVGHIGYVPKEKAGNISKLLEKNDYDIKWNVDFFCDDSDDTGINYMEIRLYSKK